jgi:hypothetical protein
MLAALLPALAIAQTQPAAASAPATATPAPASTPAAPAAQGQQAAPPQAAPAQPAQPQKPRVQANPKAQEEAGDTSELAHDIGPLKSRIPPVTGHVFLTKGRFELSPQIAFSL